MRLNPVVRSLLRDIALYRKKSGMAETTFGKEVVNNEHLIRRMQAGRVPTLKTIERVRKYMLKQKKANGSKKHLD